MPRSGRRRRCCATLSRFAPTCAHAAALQLLADNKGEMTLDELKAGTDIKPKFIYEMVANSLIQIDRSCMPNRVVSLIA